MRYNRCEKGGLDMKQISITNARKNLYSLTKDVVNNSEPVLLTNNSGGNTVIVSEEDWKALNETIYLLSVPGFMDSIRESDASEWAEYDPKE